MTKINSTTAAQSRTPRNQKKAERPKKPRRDFPLSPHPGGQWCKRVCGKLHYFGSWRDDPKGERALDRWLAERDDHQAGRVPRTRRDEPTLADLVNRFLLTKGLLRDSGERSPHTWEAYSRLCDELLAAFGQNRLLTDIRPEDFEKLRARWAAKGWSKNTLLSAINRARVIFNYAHKNDLIGSQIKFGEGFARPSNKVLRLERAAKGERMFEANELRSMLGGAKQPLQAMLWLAINGGLGNADVARLRFSHVNLKTGWMDYPRGKTGVMRRIPLWPETIAAIEDWKTHRPTPKDDADWDLVFITVRGNAWDRGTGDRAVSHEIRKLLDHLKIGGNRNFYTIRHVVETIGGETRDQVAVDAIMGHQDERMSARYRERISDDRLRAVVEQVRAWLFAQPEKPEKEKPKLKIAAEPSAEEATAAG